MVSKSRNPIVPSAQFSYFNKTTETVLFLPTTIIYFKGGKPYQCHIVLELVSKPQIRFAGKAPVEEKAQHILHM
jgi:hypothetical protein